MNKKAITISGKYEERERTKRKKTGSDKRPCWHLLVSLPVLNSAVEVDFFNLGV